MPTAFDVAVLGAGPAGLAAVAYCLHARLNVALVSPDLGGKVSYPFALRNQVPIDYVWGAGQTREFADIVARELANHIQDTASRVERLPAGGFRVQLSAGESIEARSLIVCTGVRAQRLFVAGESEYWGRGLSYSAVSHAPLFQGCNVAILGGGQRAITAARILTPLANHIDYIVARPQQMSEGDSGEQWLSHPKITIFRGWEVQQVIGDDFVTGIDLVGLTGEVRSLAVDGVFVEFGLLPNNGAVRELVELDHNGHMVIDEQCATSVPGLFAAGDVSTVCAEQVVVIGGGRQGSVVSLASPGVSGRLNEAVSVSEDSEPVGNEAFTPADARATILLAEDNEDNIVTVADYLVFKQFRVLVARTGAQCLQIAAEQRPDAILMDIQMPELDGLSAIRQLRRTPGVAHTPIVALTALAMAGDRERCLQAGANEYLSKPVSLRELAHVIEQFLHLA